MSKWDWEAAYFIHVGAIFTDLLINTEKRVLSFCRFEYTWKAPELLSNFQINMIKPFQKKMTLLFSQNRGRNTKY